jgi:hypothetical protein
MIIYGNQNIANDIGLNTSLLILIYFYALPKSVVKLSLPLPFKGI